MKLIWCSGFLDIYAQLKGGDGVSLPWVYLHSSAIYETFFGLVVVHRTMVN